MNVLVTGASGFVGNYLCTLLQSVGYKVFPVVRNETRLLGGISISDHRLVPAMHGMTDWRQALQGIDVVVNLAARVHVMSDDSLNPVEAFRVVNVDGVVNLARQASVAGVRQLVHISSIKVNGEQTFGIPYSVDSVPAPEDAYGISKHEAEQALFELAVHNPMAVTIIRPPLVYGAHVKGNINTLVNAIRKGIPLPFALVKNRRSMVSLYNLCDLVRECIANDRSYGKVFLVSDDRPVSTAELVACLSKGLGKSCRSIPVPPFFLEWVLCASGRKSMAQRLLGDLEVDISFTKEQLNWKPPFTVEESFQKMFMDV